MKENKILICEENGTSELPQFPFRSGNETRTELQRLVCPQH